MDGLWYFREQHGKNEGKNSRSDVRNKIDISPEVVESEKERIEKQTPIQNLVIDSLNIYFGRFPTILLQMDPIVLY